MREIYIKEIDKYVSRDEAIKYYEQKKRKEEREVDYKYKKMCELCEQSNIIVKVLNEINEKLLVIIKLLDGGERISIENNLKNTLSENSTK